MKKLYKDALLTQPLMATRGETSLQACANDSDTITIGGTEYIKVTDESGNDVFDTDGKQLLLVDSGDGFNLLLKAADGTPESTNIDVHDVTPEPPSEEPSEQPSEEPSEQPSEEPSEQPSEEPTESPFDLGDDYGEIPLGAYMDSFDTLCQRDSDKKCALTAMFKATQIMQATYNNTNYPCLLDPTNVVQYGNDKYYRFVIDVDGSILNVADLENTGQLVAGGFEQYGPDADTSNECQGTIYKIVDGVPTATIYSVHAYSDFAELGN